jgi:2-methylisocitrate lyase-like PEP mutase family enzyme
MSLTADDQFRRAVAFRALHEADGAFIIPNPWDAGTARLLADLGYPALATTSAGLAFALGRADAAGQVDRAETLANAAVIAAATDLPVSADLESGFARSVDELADTIRLAAEAGLVGGSIEDATGDPSRPVHPLSEAVDRVAAAAEAARALPFPFTLTARAENFLYGITDLDETITRLLAYQEAGADVLYAPGLPDLEAVRAVCGRLSRPVNVLAGGALGGFTVRELRECGARRISIGSGLARLALAGVARAAREMLNDGRFGSLADALPYAEVNNLMAQPIQSG